MYFHPQKLDRNTIPIFPYLNRVGKWDSSCHQISISDLVFPVVFFIRVFYPRIFRRTTMIPAGVMPGMRDRAAIFSGRVAFSFSTNSFVSPAKPVY